MRDARERRTLLAAALLCGAVYVFVIATFFGDAHHLGNDFSYFFPRFLDLAWWRARNGWFAVPWFSPSFCGGIPVAADGQDLSYALPGFLAPLVDPRWASMLTVLAFAAIGATGFARLLSRAFGASDATAALGGVMVLCNGAFESRALAGHMAYHGMMMVPWACAAVLPELPEDSNSRRKQLVADVLVAAMAIGYVVWCGLLNLCIPLYLGIVATLLVHQLARGGSLRDKIVRLGLGTALALALGAWKGAAFMAYFSRFPRDAYPLPGIDGLGTAVGAALQSVFAWLPPYRTPVTNTRWFIEPHEWDYATGPLGAAGILVLGGKALRERRFPRTAGRRALLAALVLLLVFPTAINVYQPAWNHFLKHLPVFSSSSHLVRWWLAYLFVAPLGVLALDLAPPGKRRQFALAGMAVTMALFALRPRPRNLVCGYDGSAVLAAWHAHRVLPVRRIEGQTAEVVQRNSVLTTGASQLRCYEPAFGYALERFPRGTLHVGSIGDVIDGTFNLKNPACYLWPAENGCVPGAAFAISQPADAIAFATHRRFHFAQSRAQRVADGVSVLAWAGMFGAATWLAISRVRRRAPG